MKFRTVIDLDLIKSKYSTLPPLSMDFIEHMIEKISKCPFFNDLEIKPSSFKGFHITVFCSIKCDICRMCYDDDKHFAYDMARPDFARNILFDKKVKIKL